jgi:hypothetical protein
VRSAGKAGDVIDPILDPRHAGQWRKAHARGKAQPHQLGHQPPGVQAGPVRQMHSAVKLRRGDEVGHPAFGISSPSTPSLAFWRRKWRRPFHPVGPVGADEMAADAVVAGDALFGDEGPQVAMRFDPSRQDGPRAVLAVCFAMKSSRSGFISDDTCPPLRVEQPQPISPASQTTTCRPPRARCSAV